MNNSRAKQNCIYSLLYKEFVFDYEKDSYAL